MLSAIAALVLRLSSAGLLDKVLGGLRAHASDETERERIDASVAIARIEAEMQRRQAQREVLVAEQGRAVTAYMRPAFAYPLAVYYAAVIADSLVGFRWNVLALPAPIGDWSAVMISAIFLSESGERIARTVARRRT